MQPLKYLIVSLSFFGSSLIAFNQAQAGSITAIVNDPSNPFWFAEGEALKKAAQELGYSIDIYAHSGDLDTEKRLIDLALARETQAIVLDPASSIGSTSAVRSATEKQVPVFIVNSSIDTGFAVQQFVSDNRSCAQESARRFSQMMSNEGRYITLHGPSSDVNAQKRSDGFNSIISQHPDMQLVTTIGANWDRNSAFEQVSKLVSLGIRFDGIWAANDEMAIGAYDAIKDKVWASGVVIAGFDGSPDAVAHVADRRLAYTVLQPIVQISQDAIGALNNYLETTERSSPDEISKYGCQIITEKTANDALQSAFQPID